jgi:predicted signal transduction protein with EAL and GGDEF domain
VPVDNPLNQWSAAFPALEIVHLLGIVCALGTAAVMNLRLLGVGPQRSPSSLWRQTALLAAGGLMVAIFSGLLLFTIAPQEYYENQVFRFKMAALAVAIVFYFTIVRWAAMRERKASVVALVSLLLFALVPLGGILAGYD